MDLKNKEISEILQEVVEKQNYLLIDFAVRGNENNPILEIYIDNARGGVTAEDCAAVSREFGEIIEQKELIGTKYRLDVSSPGLDRPLKYLQQYDKNVGRKFELKYEDDEGTRSVNAKLVRVEEKMLYFTSGKEELAVEFEKIKSAKVIISF